MSRRVNVFLFVLLSALVLSTALQAEMSVAITSPQNGEVLAPCGDVLIKFDVKYTTETIKDVRVFVNGLYRGAVKKEPWEFTWKKVMRGVYTLQAQLRTADNQEVWSEKIRVKVGPVSAGEKVQNGSFECSVMSPWSLNVHTSYGAAAKATVIDEAYFDDGNYLMIEISGGGGESWHIQLQQNIPVDSGHVYLISFMADADNKRNINITMQENQDPWAVQWGMDVEIDGANLYGPFEFEAVRTDPSNHIRFNIGANTTTLYIDDIRIVDTSASGVKAKQFGFSGAAKEFELHNAYPNPFNMETVLPFSLSQAADVTLAIYDTRGRLVRTVAAGRFEAGEHRAIWNGLDDSYRPVPSGVYVYRMTVSGSNYPLELSRKIVLVK